MPMAANGPFEFTPQDVMTGGLPDKADIVFLMDGSGSIDETDEFYKAKHLVSQVLMKLNIGEKKVRFDTFVLSFIRTRKYGGNKGPLR